MRRLLPVPLILLACSAVLALVLAEVALRAVQGAHDEPPMVPPTIGRYDPELGWSLRPGVRAISTWEGKSVEYAIGAHGFRGEDVDHAKPRDVFRIVIVGDSNTFAVGVPVEQSFPHLLEGYFDNVEVINLGVSGYGIDQELLLLQSEGVRYQPDLVIAYVPHFNNHRHMHSIRFGKEKPYFELVHDRLVLASAPGPAGSSAATTGSIPLRIKRTLAEKSRLYATVRRLLLSRVEAAGGETRDARDDQQQDARDADDEDFVTRMHRLGRVIARQMQETCSAHGADFLFVTVVGRIAESIAAEEIPLLRVATPLHNERLALPDGGHKNEAGQGITAWEIARHLVEAELVPTAHVKRPGSLFAEGD